MTVRDITVDDVFQVAEQLSPSERTLLIQRLQAITPDSDKLTREIILAEHARPIAAGMFKNAQSLANRYAEPVFVLSDEVLEAGIREFSNEWEKELDEFSGED
jgi:hypothetical protein